MKHLKKILITYPFLVFILLAFTGCGKEIEVMENNAESIYQMKYIEATFEKNEMILFSFMADDKLYVATVHGKEEGNPKSRAFYEFYKMDHDGTNQEKLSFEMEENLYLLSFCQDGSGNLLFLIKDKTNDEYTLYKADKDGKVQNQYIVTNAMTALNSELTHSGVVMDEKYIYLLGISKFVVTDKNGEIVYEEDGNFVDLTMLETGEIVISALNDKPGAVLEMFHADKKRFQVIGQFPEEFSDEISYLVPSREYTFYFYNKKGLYAYEKEEKRTIRLIDWNASNLDINWLSCISEVGKGEFICVTSETTDNHAYELIELSPNTEDAAGKKSISIAGIDIDSRIKAAVMEFNQENEEYRIECIDFSRYEEPLKTLNTQLAAGESFDLICMKNVSEDALINKGLLLDLNAFFERDQEISPDEFVMPVLDALSRDGCLYSISPGFGISVVMGRASQVGTDPGWTPAEFQKAVRSEGKDMEIFYCPANMEILWQLTSINLDSFINREEKNCSFDNEDFIGFLEFAGQYSDDIRIQTESMPAMVQEKKLLLANENIVDFTDIMVYNRMFGEDLTFIGYPAIEGTGNAFDCQGMNMGICSYSENQEDAWEFLKYLLSKEYQSHNCYPNYFPIRKECLQYYIDITSASEPYTTKEGVKVNPYYAEITYEDYEVKLDAMRDEEIEMFWKLVESTHKTNSCDEELIGMILEEAKDYFSGRRSAEETAKAIEKRVNLYLNE